MGKFICAYCGQELRRGSWDNLEHALNDVGLERLVVAVHRLAERSGRTELEAHCLVRRLTAAAGSGAEGAR